MGIDLYTNRNDTPERAKWWSVNEKNKKVEEIVHKDIPNLFYCVEKSSQATNSNRAGTMIQYDNDNITIMTRDKLKGIKNHDLVKYRNKFWLVEGIQKTAVKGNLEYSTRPSFETYLTLRGLNE